jgi:hypothetical protein
MGLFEVSSHDAIYSDVLCHVFSYVGDIGVIARLSAVCKVFRSASHARLRVEFPLVKPETPIRWEKHNYLMKTYINWIIVDHQNASIKFFCENGLDLSENLPQIVEFGSISMIELAMKHRPDNLERSKSTGTLIDLAVKTGRPHMVSFLYKHYGNELLNHDVSIRGVNHISKDMMIMLARWPKRGSPAQEWAQGSLDDLSVDLRRTKTIGLNRRRTSLQPGSTRHVRAPFKPPREFKDFW